MRVYTLHYPPGLIHLDDICSDLAQGNMPYEIDGFDDGAGHIGLNFLSSDNARIVSNEEIIDDHGVKGGHGEYCLEIKSVELIDSPQYAFYLPLGGYGGTVNDVGGFYLKFDFMYTNTNSGTVIQLNRAYVDNVSRELSIYLEDGYLTVAGCKHTHPNPIGSEPPTYRRESWISREDGRFGTIYIAPDKWHEIQVFIQPQKGWDISDVGPEPGPIGYYAVNPFVTFFEQYEQTPAAIPTVAGSEAIGSSGLYSLMLDSWPADGHPMYPNVMLSGQNQSAWPPENYASGQYFYAEELGMVYIWVNGKLDIQHTTNMVNEQDGEYFDSHLRIYPGYSITGSDGRFFFNNIILNDFRNPSGSYPSKIFDPLCSNHPSLEWNPSYKLKFTAIELDTDYWRDDSFGSYYGRKHNTWMPDYPKGALVPSGDPYFVDAPNRFGAPTDRMIPHGTKLTCIQVAFDGDVQDFQSNTGNAAWHTDYPHKDYHYQLMQPQDSQPLSSAGDRPNLKIQAQGDMELFYLKRPPSVSGKQPLAGGYFGIDGPKDYVPIIYPELGDSELPIIYRIWTCIWDHNTSSYTPVDQMHHLIRVPSGVSGHVDYISDNPTAGTRLWASYPSGSAAFTDGFSMADWPYNPVTGNPWTWNDLEALQIGASSVVHNVLNNQYLTTIYLLVEHASHIDPDVSILGTNLLEDNVADDIPFFMQTKEMYRPGWRLWEEGKHRTYYNKWDINPIFQIDRTNRQSTDGQAVIINPVYSGAIEYDYNIRYINGEIVQGTNYRRFDEHFDQVWVYTIDGMTPPETVQHRLQMRHEVITDASGNYFSYLGHPVLEWNTKKYPTDNDLSPLDHFPYVVYDYNTIYVIPLSAHNIADTIDPNDIYRTWTDATSRPSNSGNWIINKQQNVFDFAVDPDSYFHPFSPSSVANHALTHPNETLDYTFPASRNNHDYYFKAPDLPSGSVFQTIPLTDKFGIPEEAIDHGLYSFHMGLYQTTANQATNDTGEGRFDFYSGPPGVSTHISGYTFGPDGTVGWHLNETSGLLPSGTRQVRFTFNAIRNTDAGKKSPGGTLGGTSNFATFDEPFFILDLSSGITDYSFHPADTNQDNRVTNVELANYISQWQSGILSLGEMKKYLTKAEEIWQQGPATVLNEPSGGLYIDADDGPRPENWEPSGYV